MPGLRLVRLGDADGGLAQLAAAAVARGHAHQVPEPGGHERPGEEKRGPDGVAWDRYLIWAAQEPERHNSGDTGSQEMIEILQKCLRYSASPVEVVPTKASASRMSPTSSAAQGPERYNCGDIHSISLKK